MLCIAPGVFIRRNTVFLFDGKDETEGAMSNIPKVSEKCPHQGHLDTGLFGKIN